MRDHDQSPLPSPEPDGSKTGAADTSCRGKVGKGSQAQTPADDEAQQAFVRAMRAKIDHKLGVPLDDELQVEIATLMRLLVTMPWQSIVRYRVYFELAFDLLASEKPNMIVVRSLRYEIGEIKDRSAGGLIRFLTYLSGTTPLHAVLSALLFVVVLSLLSILTLIAGHGLINLLHDKYMLEVPLFGILQPADFRMAMLLIHAAFIGSVVSIVVRLGDFLSIAAFNSVLIFVSVLTRPFISVMFAILAFVMMKGGVVSFLGIDLDGSKGAYLAWGIGFLCGFSERLAQDFIRRSSGALGETGSPIIKRPE